MIKWGKAYTREEKSWIMYDVGNSAFVMLSSTLIPLYFASITNTDSPVMVVWGFAEAVASLILALAAPFLGNLADIMGNKKKFLIGTAGSGVIACAALGVSGDPAVFLALYVFASVMLNSSTIFYDAFLVDAAAPHRRNMVSAAGFAWGYIGSCIPFILCFLIMLKGDAIGVDAALGAKLSFVITAAWWLIFSIPVLRNISQKHGRPKVKGGLSLKKTFQDVGKTFGYILHNKTLLFFVLAYFFYIDGVHAIIKMSATFGTDIGLDAKALVSALLLTQIVAFPATIIYGKLADKVGAWRMILVSIVCYFLIIMYAAFFLHNTTQFCILAGMVGLFQGGIQALSRSYFSNLIPADKSNEFFGVFNLFGKYASIPGTFLVSVTTLLTGSPSLGICSLGIMFVIALAFFVKIPRFARD